MTDILRTKITNPLDELFNINEQDLSLGDEYEPMTEGALAEISGAEEPVEKDEEDILIDTKIDDVYDAAIGAFNQQTQYMEVIEPRYAARNAEVAAQYLNIALSAANSRAKVKSDRKKQMAFVPYSNNKTSGTVVASREDIMRMLAVDVEIKK